MKNKIFLLLSLVAFFTLFTFFTIFADQTSDIYFHRGIQKYLSGNIEEAINDVEQAISLGAKDKKVSAFLVKVLLERGGVLFQNKQYQDALPYFEKAKKYDPENQKIQEVISTILEKLNPKNVLPSPTPSQEVTTKISDDTAIAELIKTLQINQDKLIEKITQPNEMVRQIIAKSDDERKELISMLDKKNESIIESIKSEKESIKSLTYFGIVAFISAVVFITLIIYFISIKINLRREAIMMKQQETIINMMVQQQEALAQGSTTLRLTSGSSDYITPKEMLNDPKPRIRAKGIEIIDAQLIREDEDPEVVERILKQFLEDKDNRVRANAVKVLYRYKPDKAIKIIKNMINSKDKWMRVSAAWVLGELEGTPEEVEILLSNLNDEDYHFKRRVIKSLLKLSEKLPEKTKVKIKEAIENVAHKEKWVV